MEGIFVLFEKYILDWFESRPLIFKKNQEKYCFQKTKTVNLLKTIKGVRGSY